MSQYSPQFETPNETVSLARILVVDDDVVLRSTHEAVLQFEGYHTESAEDGEEALVMLATSRFDLVLTDRNMPNLDGCGLIRALRKGGSRIPVMMVSGSLAGDGTLPDDVRNEVTVALPKPALVRDILAGVAHSLRPMNAVPRKERITHVFRPAAGASTF